MGRSSSPIQKKPFIWTNLDELERACFPEFLENFGERQILWSLCSVVFKCARWHLNSQFLCVQVKNVKKVRKTSTPLEQAEQMKENESENRL